VTMRTNRPALPVARAAALVVGLAGMLAASPALANGAGVAGVYDVKFEEVSTNCQAPLRYPHGKLEIKVKGKTLTVDIMRTPVMTGSLGKGGKVSAKSRSGATMMEGMKGVFSVAGKVTPEGMLSLVMVGEYTAGGKPLCSQSWNVVGSRVDEPAAKPNKQNALTSLLPELVVNMM
jgi:hypothetical protein